MSYMEQEIREQPAVLARLLGEEVANARALAEEIRRRKIQYILLRCMEHRTTPGVTANICSAP